MSGLQSLIYVSSATGGLSVRDLIDILEKSTEQNQRDGVHGMLLLCDGNFMQCIEGKAAGVESTYARILASRKHHGIVEILRSTVAQHQFSGWDWGFQSGFHREFSTPRTAQFLETSLQAHPDASIEITPAQKILREFWIHTAKPFRIWEKPAEVSGLGESRVIQNSVAAGASGLRKSTSFESPS